MYSTHRSLTAVHTILLRNDDLCEAQNNIRKKGSVKEQKEQLLKEFETTIEELKYEKEVIMDAAAKFAHFMKNGLMVAYNDAFDDYLDYLIQDEEEKKEHRNRDRIQKLMKDKVTYGQHIQAVKEALKTQPNATIEPKDIFEMKRKLMKLKHYGPDLEELIGNYGGVIQQMLQQSNENKETNTVLDNDTEKNIYCFFAYAFIALYICLISNYWSILEGLFKVCYIACVISFILLRWDSDWKKGPERVWTQAATIK